ncbi:MAG: transporter substrate-binding domain-containing protein [Desulfobacter sp.]|nr:MAG: transporter substrate-binding domain-containing protein [Desulfobacter sp.]
MKRICLLTALFYLFLAPAAAGPLPKEAASSLPIKKVLSASPSWERFTNKDGTGLYHEILNRIFSDLGVQVSHKYTNAKRGLYLVRNGQADMYTCKNKDGILPGLLLGRHKMYEGRFYAVFKKNNINSWQGPSSLIGRKIVWRRGYYKNSEFPAGIIPIETDSGNAALGQILIGRCDVYIDDLNLIQETIAASPFKVPSSDLRIEPVGARSYYPVFQDSKRGRTIMALYDAGMERLITTGALEKIFKKWGHPFPDYDE